MPGGGSPSPRPIRSMSPLDRARRLSLCLMSAGHRQLAAKDHRVHFITGKRPRADIAQNAVHRNVRKDVFMPGDLVEIRPWKEIRQTLDDDFSTRGLVFMPGMERFCGRRARVFKRIRMLYDEHQRKMVKVRNAYILDGVICKGRNAFDKEGCDKSCFYFWNCLWLRRIEQQ